MAKRIAVFFYGLFMDADVLRSKDIDPIDARRASVPGFALRIGQRATLVPEAKGRAYGMLMELRHDEIDRLYADPSVQMYRPEAVISELEDGSRVAALCFTLTSAPGPSERNEEYAAKLRELGRRLHLPEDYIGQMR